MTCTSREWTVSAIYVIFSPLSPKQRGGLQMAKVSVYRSFSSFTRRRPQLWNKLDLIAIIVIARKCGNIQVYRCLYPARDHF